jgi:hypothetical protein
LNGEPFWTPYRKGVAVALLSFGSTLFFVVGLLLVLTRQAGLPVWLLVPALLIAALTSPALDPEMRSRGGFLSCPVCRKPLFQASGRSSFGAYTNRLWPEKDCSECGADLTGGRGL